MWSNKIVRREVKRDSRFEVFNFFENAERQPIQPLNVQAS